MAKKVVNFNLDTTVIDGIRMLSEAEDRPMSRIVNSTLAEYLANRKADAIFEAQNGVAV
jgi:hypothetical protein